MSEQFAPHTQTCRYDEESSVVSYSVVKLLFFRNLGHQAPLPVPARNESHIFACPLHWNLPRALKHWSKFKGQSQNYTSNIHWSQVKHGIGFSVQILSSRALVYSELFPAAFMNYLSTGSPPSDVDNLPSSPQARSMRIWTTWGVNHWAQRPVLMSKMM